MMSSPCGIGQWSSHRTCRMTWCTWKWTTTRLLAIWKWTCGQPGPGGIYISGKYDQCQVCQCPHTILCQHCSRPTKGNHCQVRRVCRCSHLYRGRHVPHQRCGTAGKRCVTLSSAPGCQSSSCSGQLDYMETVKFGSGVNDRNMIGKMVKLAYYGQAITKWK